MKLKYDFVIQDIGGKSFAVAAGKDIKRFNGLVRLNATGKALFEMLQKGMTQQEILTRFQESYDGADEQDILNTIQYFKEAGILE